MTASKLGMSIVTVALLAAAAVSQAQQAEQTQKAPQAQNAPQASNAAAVTAKSAATATDKAAAAGTANSSSAAKSTAGAQAPNGGLPIELVKEARDEGFRPVTRNNVTVYCKSEIIVGSAFPVRTCYDEARMRSALEEYQAQRLQLQQMHGGGLQGH